jgi:hypothetical protein
VTTAASYTIRWYFPETDDPQTYTLRYTRSRRAALLCGRRSGVVEGSLRRPSVPVLASRVRVVVPSPATIDEWAAYINGADARYMVTAERLDNDRTIIFTTAQTLYAGEELEVRVQFTHGCGGGDGAQLAAAADAAAAKLRRAAGISRPLGAGRHGAAGHVGAGAAAGRPGIGLSHVVQVTGATSRCSVWPITLPEPPDDRCRRGWPARSSTRAPTCRTSSPPSSIWRGARR